ncbi:MAG: hypothetical protein GY925_12900 [Actinomycetia bacterium]|nr:hypothetical protein [Actinomycetes bacterium]
MTVDTQELRWRRRRAKEHEALLRYLCDLAHVQCHTWYRLPFAPEESHPEDNHRFMVETGDNGSGEYVMVEYGFDSDVAKLVAVLSYNEPEAS